MPIVCTTDFEKTQATDRLNFLVKLGTFKIELDKLVKALRQRNILLFQIFDKLSF